MKKSDDSPLLIGIVLTGIVVIASGIAKGATPGPSAPSDAPPSGGILPPQKGEHWSIVFGLSRPLTSPEYAALQRTYAAGVSGFATIDSIAQGPGDTDYQAFLYVRLSYIAPAPAPLVGQPITIPGPSPLTATMLSAHRD